MMLDLQNLVSNNQAPGNISAGTVSTNSIDLGASVTDTLGNTVLSDVGRADRVYMLAQVSTTCVGAGATVVMRLITATDAALTAGIVVHQQTDPIPVASLVAGYQFKLGNIPPGLPATGRYLGAQWVIATANISAGGFTIGIVSDKQTNPTV